MRSEWVERDKIKIVLALLMPANRLAIEMSLRYGMRIGDVLATRRCDVERGNWTYKESKTGKSRRVTVSTALQTELLAQAGPVYIFTHRTDWQRHRTRQAVYKDIRRVATMMQLSEHISPHSARKIYAVERLKGSTLARVQRLLNHDNEAVTMIYALADKL